MSTKITFILFLAIGSFISVFGEEQILLPGVYQTNASIGFNSTLFLEVEEENKVLAQFLTIGCIIGENGELDVWGREVRGQIKKKSGKVIFELSEDGEFWPLDLEFDQISDSKIQALDTPSGYISVKSDGPETEKEWLIIERSAEQGGSGNPDKPDFRP